MKQIPITPALEAMIKQAVGDDVDPSEFAVFEAIALNTKPLPGKRGSLFEDAIVSPITLKAMVDHVNGEDGHLPLVADHELLGAPKGRVFHAGLDFDPIDGVQMRVLFYLDPTEVDLIAKLNAGSLDELSVSFLSERFMCSSCGWDYFELGSSDNIWDRTCGNGHQIGQDGVHGEMIGLNQFIEISLVARGAADKPKIIGKSQAKLAPDALKRLAASGFETDELVVQASLGKKEDTMDITALTTQLSTANQQVGTLTAELAQARTDLTGRDESITALNADVASRDEQIAALTTERDELQARPEVGVADDLAEATAYLQEQLNHLLVASGSTKLEGDDLPSKPAELKAKISELTGNLTSIIPVDGKAAPAGGADGDDVKGTQLSAVDPSAFQVRR